MSEPSGKRKRLAPRGALVTIGIIVGTGLVLFSAFAFIPALRNATIQPIVDSYQERKARDLVKQARAHFEAQEWGEAIQAANEAYREAPEEPEAMRIMAEMCSTRRENLPRAIFFRNKIIAAGADTVEDHRGLAYAHLTLGNHRDADKALQVLLQKFPNDPGGLELLAKFQASRGDMEQATQTALRSLELNPEEGDNLIRTALLKTTSPFDEVQREGWAECMELARRTDAVGIRAATKIADLGSLPGLYLKELIAILRNHPMAGEPERMRSLSIEIEMEPLRRDELISEEVSRRLDQPVEDAADFFSWLLNNGEHDRIIQLLSPRAAKINERLFAVYIDSLGAANRWGEASAIIDSADVPLETAHLNLFKAACAKNLGKPDEIVRSLALAAQNAAAAGASSAGKSELNARQMLQVGNFCEKNELEDVAKVSYEAARFFESTKEAAINGLFRIARQGGDTKAMLDLAADAAKDYPQKTDYAAMVAYLSALLGEDIEIAADRAERIFQEEPNLDQHKIILGLARLRLKNYQGAKDVCADVTATKLSPSYRAVYSAIMGRSGEQAVASSVAKGVTRELILPEEERLLGPWL